MRQMKGCGSFPQLCYCAQPTIDKIERYFKPIGICFIKTVKGKPFNPFQTKKKKKKKKCKQ